MPPIDPCRDRAIGALVGLVVGDAIGTTLEFAPRDSAPPLTDMIGGGPFALAPGQWTDDSAMALALADSLIACGGLDEADLIGRFRAWWREGAYSCTGECFDIGQATIAALQRHERTGAIHAGSARPDSAGNGSLMRLAPVAIRFYADPAARADAARRQSLTTHGAPACIHACIAFADMLAEAIAGHPKAIVLRPRATGDAGAGDGADADPADGDAALDAVLAGSWRGKPRAAISSSGYVVDSLEAALWCVDQTDAFAAAVLLAANLGDDADTVAAITGQLAGALYGASAIPDAWRARIAWGARIEQAAGALFAG